MTWTTVDLSTATFPAAGVGGAISGGNIVSAAPGEEVEFVIPGLTVDLGRHYQFEFTFDMYDSEVSYPAIAIYDANDAETASGYWYVGDIALEGDGEAVTLTLTVGPGINEWDVLEAFNLTRLWFFQESDLVLTGMRYRAGSLSGWSDYYDDANLSWQNRIEFINDRLHGQLSTDDFIEHPGGATMENAWNGTGDPDIEIYNNDDFRAQCTIDTPSFVGTQWRQEWLTIKRSATEPTVTFSTLPAQWDTAPPAEVEWEPTNTPLDHRLNVEVLTPVAGEYRLKGFWDLYSEFSFAPPTFINANTVRLYNDLDIRNYPGGPTAEGGAGNTNVLIPGSVLEDLCSFPLTGAAQMVLTATDPRTQSGEWEYGEPFPEQIIQFSAVPETAFRPRYRVRTFVPGNLVTAPRRKYPRDDGRGVGPARHYPPPTSRQKSIRRGGATYL